MGRLPIVNDKVPEYVLLVSVSMIIMLGGCIWIIYGIVVMIRMGTQDLDIPNSVLVISLGSDVLTGAGLIGVGLVMLVLRDIARSLAIIARSTARSRHLSGTPHEAGTSSTDAIAQQMEATYRTPQDHQ